MSQAVAQSGIPSAVGLAIESSWGTAPISAGAGYTNVIGVAGTSPHRFWTVDPGGGFPGRAEIETPHDEIDGDIELTRTIHTANSYQGDFTWKADGENLYYPLLGFFGRDVQTSSGSGAYKHVFTPNKYIPSFLLEEILGDNTYARVSTGLLIQRLTFTFGKIVTVTMQAYPRHQVPNSYVESGTRTDFLFDNTQRLIPTVMGGDGSKTWARTASPTYVDVAQGNNGNGPFVFADMEGVFGSETGFTSHYLTIDDTPVDFDILEGSTLVMERVIDVRQTGGSGREIGACVGNQVVVSGNLMGLFRDQTIQAAVLKRSKVGFNFKFQGNVIGGSQNYYLEVYVPWLNFNEDGLKIPGGTMIVNGPFTAKKDPSALQSVKVTVQNTFDHTTLAGTVGSTPGGLGGWSAS